MAEATIGWCDLCEEEVSLDHDCTRQHNLHKVVKAVKEINDADD